MNAENGPPVIDEPVEFWDNRLKFKTSEESSIVLDESMEKNSIW